MKEKDFDYIKLHGYYDHTEHEVINAQIENTMLGTEDYGIFTFSISLNYGSTHQAFGHYSLDNPVKDENGNFVGRVGTDIGTSIIMEILKIVGVSKWEDLKGKYVRVLREKGFAGYVKGMANILFDKWFVPELIFKEYENEKARNKKNEEFKDIMFKENNKKGIFSKIKENREKKERTKTETNNKTKK